MLIGNITLGERSRILPGYACMIAGLVLDQYTGYTCLLSGDRLWEVPNRGPGAVGFGRRKHAIVSQRPFKVGKELIIEVQRFLSFNRANRRVHQCSGVFATHLDP